MNKFIKFLLAFSICLNSYCVSFAQDFEWKNDLRSKFLNNEAVIMEINIRSFNSKDFNGDGFIQENSGEIRGTFLNAVERLDEIKNLGINTLHILPVTPTGKLKAMGTAGSLYSAADFASLNPDMYDKNSSLTLEQQAQKFVDEAHRRNIRVIFDLPACASYDLFLQRPDLFVKGPSGEPVVPSDWTDVRLLSTGTEDKIDSNVYGVYKDFVKLAQRLDVDGIRADVATSKTSVFWKELINYSRNKDPEFLWLAEASESWEGKIAPQAVFTPYNKLLEAGFDGYYGSFFNLKNWKNSSQLYTQIFSTLNESKKYSDKKSVIGSFTTHDEVSPILIKGPQLSEMMIWLNATLPINSYFVDGFQTGDDYLYLMQNKLAPLTYTDDNIYFTHRGQIDIFNLSRKPEGQNISIKNNFILGNDVKKSILPVLNNGTFTSLKTRNNNIFGYYFEYNKKMVLTLGNLDFDNAHKVVVKIPKYTKKSTVLPLKITQMPEIKSGKIHTEMKPGEIMVLVVNL